MEHMANADIQAEIKAAGVRKWRIADALGVSISHFSIMLRHELSAERKEEVRTAIRNVQASEGIL